MDDRKQFTFYVSYWEAIEELPAKSQLPVLKAIIKYALFGEEPKSLSGACRSIFLLVKPTLDASRKKAANGKQGGSKPKANRKQTPREKENEKESEGEKENENENEVEEEIEKESLSLSGAGGNRARAGEASEEEILSIGLKPGEYLGVTSDMVEEVRRVTDVIFRKYMPARTVLPFDYRHVFRYCGEYGRAELLDYAFEKAASAGKVSDWRYIDGIMDTLSLRRIETMEEARQWDEDRPDRDSK